MLGRQKGRWLPREEEKTRVRKELFCLNSLAYHAV